MTLDCRLYLITPPALTDLADFGRQLARALEGGDVAALQIRLKDAPDDLVAAAVDVLGPIAQARDVAVILNDRPDLAARLPVDLDDEALGPALAEVRREHLARGLDESARVFMIRKVP